MLRKLFPFLNWFPVNRAILRADFIAGLTVALVLIPQSMAYADLAGLPPWVGLYTGFLPVIVGALWGSSNHLNTGPVATSSLLTATVLIGMNGATGTDLMTTAAMLAVLVGVIRLLIGFLRLTFVANFISRPVLEGFTHACVLVIASSQLGKIAGLQMSKSGNYLRDLWEVLLRFDDLNPVSLTIGLGSIAVLVVIKKYAPKWPGALIVVVFSICAVYFGKLHEGVHAVKVVGEVPAGLPKFVWAVPDWDTSLQMLSGAAAIIVISFMEMCSVSKAIAAQSKQRLNLNQEIIGQGLASISSGLSGGYPVSGSFSRSALNFASGARTGLSSVVAGLFILVFLLFFTKYLYFLPQPALAAIIIVSIVKLLNFGCFIKFWEASWLDGMAAVITFVCALLFAPQVQNGIFVGIVVALCVYLYETMKPRVVIVGEHADGTLREAGEPGLTLDEEMPLIRVDSRIFFANSAWVEDAILRVESEHPNAKVIALSCEGMNGIDSTGVEMLRDLSARLRDGGVRLILIGLKNQVEEVFKRARLDKDLGEENLFRTLQQARIELKKYDSV
ncbi:SulP family inorganic anion transporter [Verrucomicrobiota bacterium]